ncbi:MAG TPA: DUF222 domain-containing protein [Streptosporangiaceae bacterium]|nr:DUF222 domain-containing protein [Streptosporangiaceae bacterium]
MPAPGQQPATPSSAAEALGMLDGALGYLASADAGSLTLAEQAATLHGLERAEARHTAALTRALSAFVSGGGLEADGHCSARSWLMWQARITRGAASGAVGWMHRLRRHPALADALAAAEISPSWAGQISGWTDLLPDHLRADGDAILLAAAAGGADLADLAALAAEMRQRSAQPDTEDKDGFTDRGVRLDLTYENAGKLSGDLTPECAAALAAVLESLGKKAGPEDDRTKQQRDHDALEEGCRRLVAAGCLPDRAGQPTQIQLHLTLDQLRSLDGAADAGHGSAAEAERVWAAGRAAGDGEPGWVSGRAAAEAYACDAQITPIVFGRVNRAALAKLTGEFLAALRPGFPPGTGRPPGTGLPPVPGGVRVRDRRAPRSPDPATLPPRTLARLQDLVLAYAADVLSGPAGLAAFLRTGLLAAEFPPAQSLPLDVGAATATVPPHLRRAVIARDRHCAFAGCRQPPAACQVHHIKPRSQGGATCLSNLLLLCPFHHLIAIHRWGWTLALNGDGTTTATSPDSTKVLHSHGPPGATAA